MNLTSPSQVRRLLEAIDLRPSKPLGQNFLIDRNILDILVRAAVLTPADHVLEVGPGLGVVTEKLLSLAGRVTAVEKDTRLFDHLQAQLGASPRLTLVSADILDVDLEELLGSGITKCVSTLPYSVGSRVLAGLVMADRAPGRIVVTVQQEVAERLCATEGRQYGLLSVWSQSSYDVEYVKRVSRTCFWPVPEVESAIVCMTRQPPVFTSPAGKRMFREITKLAFMHRRKQMAGILAGLPASTRVPADRALEYLGELGIDSAARPEAIRAGDWAQLANMLTH